MPTLILLASKADAKRLKTHVDEIGLPLREAAAQALNLQKGAESVSFVILSYVAASNMERCVLFGLASHSDDRITNLNDWKDKLGTAWKNLRRKKRKLADVMDILNGEAGIWPLMPFGAFLTVPGVESE